MHSNSLNISKHHKPSKTGLSHNPMRREKYILLSPSNKQDENVLKQNLSSSLLKYQKIKRLPSAMSTNRRKVLLNNYFVNFQMPLITRNIQDDSNEEEKKRRVIKYKVPPQFRNQRAVLSKKPKALFNSEIITSSPIIHKNITISSIIAGQLSNLSPGIINESYKNYCKPIKSNDINSTDYIKAFAANTYRGKHNDKNYNKILVILKVSQPKKKKDQEWPCCSIFGLFDGMDGDGCSEYLKNELHQHIMKEHMFPRAMDKAMIEGYEKADAHFLKTIKTNSGNPSLFLGSNERSVDKSGSCALEIFFMNFICYIANVGDSKVFLIKNNLEEYEQVTTVHNSTNSHEHKRIIRNGGTFKTLQVQMGNKENKSIYLPCYEYVFPGMSRTTRVMGIIEGKVRKSNDKERILLSTPDVISLRIRRDIDFVLVGNYELFTKLSMKDILECIRMIFNPSSYNSRNDIHSQCSLAVELIIKTAQHRETIGNLSCILIMIRK